MSRATAKDIEELFADWKEYADRTRDAWLKHCELLREEQGKLLAEQFNSVFGRGDKDASTG